MRLLRQLKQGAFHVMADGSTSMVRSATVRTIAGSNENGL